MRTIPPIVSGAGDLRRRRAAARACSTPGSCIRQRSASTLISGRHARQEAVPEHADRRQGEPRRRRRPARVQRRSRRRRCSRARRSGATGPACPAAATCSARCARPTGRRRPSQTGIERRERRRCDSDRGEEALGDLRVPDREARTDRADLLRSRDVRAPTGWCTCTSTAQNPQAMRWRARDDARACRLDKVVVREYDGSGHYGRSNGGSTGAEDEAVILSQIVGKPVRAPVDAVGRHAVVDAASRPRSRTSRPAWTRAGSSSRSRPSHYMPAMQDDRMVGRAARRAADDDGPGGRAVPGHASARSSNASPSPGSTTRCRTRVQTAFGTWQVGTDPTTAELRHADRASRPQHADAGSAAAELRSGVDDERARRRGEDRPDPVPDQQHERRPADRGDERGQDRVRLGDAAVAEPECRRRPGRSRSIGQGFSAMLRQNCVLGLRRARCRSIPKTGKVSVLNVTTAVDPGIVDQPPPAEAQCRGRHGDGRERGAPRAGALQQVEDHTRPTG